MIRAWFETPTFTFEAFAETCEEVDKVIAAAWKIHASQTGADEDYTWKYEQDIQYTEICSGQCFRDGELLLTSETG